MPNIKIDNQDYDLDALSEVARKRVEMVTAVDRRLFELQRDLAIMQTARISYMNALKEALPGAQLAGPAVSGETLKFGP